MLRKPNAPEDRWLPPEMKQALEAYLDWLQIHDYSRHTVRQRRYAILFFITWSDERGIAKPDEVTPELVESYQRWMFHFRQENGKPLTVKARSCRLSALKAWYGWMRRQKRIVIDPTLDIEMPKEERRLPRNILTEGEVEQLLVQPDVKTLLGLRDRTARLCHLRTGHRDRREALRLVPVFAGQRLPRERLRAS